MYIGEDPDAPNWDPEHKMFRSPLHGGAGPMTSVRQHKAIVHTDGNVSDYVHLVRNWLDRMSLGDFGHRGTMQDNPSAEPLFPHFLYPRIKELEPRWYEDEGPSRGDSRHLRRDGAPRETSRATCARRRS